MDILLPMGRSLRELRLTVHCHLEDSQNGRRHPIRLNSLVTLELQTYRSKAIPAWLKLILCRNLENLHLKCSEYDCSTHSDRDVSVTFQRLRTLEIDCYKWCNLFSIMRSISIPRFLHHCIFNFRNSCADKRDIYNYQWHISPPAYIKSLNIDTLKLSSGSLTCLQFLETPFLFPYKTVNRLYIALPKEFVHRNHYTHSGNSRLFPAPPVVEPFERNAQPADSLLFLSVSSKSPAAIAQLFEFVRDHCPHITSLGVSSVAVIGEVGRYILDDQQMAWDRAPSILTTRCSQIKMLTTDWPSGCPIEDFIQTLFKCVPDVQTLVLRQIIPEPPEFAKKCIKSEGKWVLGCLKPVFSFLLTP